MSEKFESVPLCSEQNRCAEWTLHQLLIIKYHTHTA